MLILSNNCIAGYIYRDILKQQYQHPFIWSGIHGNNLIKFLNNFEILNFNDFELKKKTQGFNIPWDWYIQIENKINVEYRHMWFSPKDEKPRIQNNEVFYNKIWEYIVEKYETRLKRMKIENPIIFIEDKDNKDDVVKAIDICKKKNYKCFAFTNKLPITSSNTLMVRPHNLNTDEPNDYVKKYKQDIIDFLNHS